MLTRHLPAAMRTAAAGWSASRVVPSAPRCPLLDDHDGAAFALVRLLRFKVAWEPRFRLWKGEIGLIYVIYVFC